MHEVDSCLRGFHVYGDIWTPTVGESLICKQQIGNLNDPYAVAIKKGSEVIGHVPRKLSAACSRYLLRSGFQCLSDCLISFLHFSPCEQRIRISRLFLSFKILEQCHAARINKICMLYFKKWRAFNLATARKFAKPPN